MNLLHSTALGLLYGSAAIVTTAAVLTVYDELRDRALRRSKRRANARAAVQSRCAELAADAQRHLDAAADRRAQRMVRVARVACNADCMIDSEKEWAKFEADIASADA